MAADEPESGRSASTDTLWSDVRIDPVEIALPGGVGYTLRAYREKAELAAEAEASDEAHELDDFDAASAAVIRGRRPAVDHEAGDDEADRGHVGQDRAAAGSPDDLDEDDLDKDDLDKDDLDDDLDEEADEDQDDEDEDEDDEDQDDDENAEGAPEEVPVFLGRKGRVYLFHSPEKLVDFVRSAPDHDLSQLDTWSDLVERIRVDDVVPLPEDTYELDLVVANLRGGADAWDGPLIMKAGELARDLAYALRLPTVLSSLGSGSPLDDLDEALRAAETGGVGAFFARRRLRRIPAQQSSIAWRTLIGKISAVADWRD